MIVPIRIYKLFDSVFEVVKQKMDFRAIVFFKRLGSIRLSSISKLLFLYYFTFIEQSPELRLMHKGKRSVKTEPGLQTIMDTLKCSKSTAQDYLRGLEILRRQIVLPMVEREIEKRNDPKWDTSKWKKPDDFRY